ncbi:putative restriction endonuclease type I, S subunit [Sinorhizobium fredii NGR234]|uniref:Restriction endonuclease type I, S subunit n=1 Tax=Sinorhizobium fredii (strain NBRC 101917 / NGR234) TaxID=394 RepID=C3MFA1_SINFN|nr:restriction endonuclease subunit S [Sinorhizobium fredii]ACP23938.1 putative restriction endonuclease type I, S subunit [Sinorhizobium fredii NGR234]
MSELPRGWCVTTIQEIADVGTGATPKRGTRAFYESGTIPWITSGAVSQRQITYADEFITEAAIRSTNCKVFPTGTILVAMYGEGKTRGSVARLAIDAATNQALAAIVLPNDDIVSSEFLMNFLTSQYSQLRGLAAGGVQPNLNLQLIRSTSFPLPPLAEQKRIVAKLDALSAKSARARTELARIETLVYRYKQAVLGKAFSGELTVDFRLSRRHLQSEAKAGSIHGEEGVERKLKVRGTTDVMKGIQLSPLPESWNWVKNHRLAQNRANAICAGPFGTIFKAKDFRDKGIPIIFLRHVAAGEYRTHKPGFMDKKVWQELHQPYSVFGGELLVTKLGDPPGVACIFPAGVGTAMVTPDVMKMSVDENASVPKFLMFYFNSPIAKNIIHQLAFGLTRLRVDLAMFKTFPVPHPSLEEQLEIVRRIESAFAKIDRLAAEAKRALDLVGKLDEAILAKAFRGELVPQDENDEPAENLLERIRAERAAAPKAKRGRGNAKG